MALLKEQCVADGLGVSDEVLARQLRLHLHRGISYLATPHTIRSIGDLVDTIKPAAASVQGKPGDVLDNAIRANVERGVERLKVLEPMLAGPVKAGRVKVAGAVYDLRGGKVTVLG